jgi:hypothetical protein
MILIYRIGNFLPDLVICIHGACDPSLNVSQLLDPLASVCSLLGTPVSETALKNAEQQASSLASQVTVTETVTYTSGNVAVSPVGPATASTTTGGQPLTVVTLTTTSEGASSATQTVPSNAIFTSLIPVVIVGTNSAGSTYTTTTTEPGAISTITTINSDGCTETVVSTYTQPGIAGAGGVIVQTITTTNSAGSTYTTTQTSSQSSSSSSPSSSSSSSTSVSSTTTATTSIAAQSTTGSFATSATSVAPNPDETNSSPFGSQSAADQHRVGSLLGIAILFIVVGVWL